MKILFIRHGQTKNNAEQKWLGSTDVSLWEEGINALLKNKSNKKMSKMIFLHVSIYN